MATIKFSRRGTTRIKIPAMRATIGCRVIRFTVMNVAPGLVKHQHACWCFTRPAATFMTVNLITLQPIVALIAGILILVVPRLLNFIVAIYLILVGVTGLWPHVLQ